MSYDPFNIEKFGEHKENSKKKNMKKIYNKRGLFKKLSIL